jgi:hypothetical protein
LSGLLRSVTSLSAQCGKAHLITVMRCARAGLAEEGLAVLGCSAVAQRLVPAWPPPGCASGIGGPVARSAPRAARRPSGSHGRTAERANPVGTVLAHSPWLLTCLGVAPRNAIYFPAPPRRRTAGTGHGRARREGHSSLRYCNRCMQCRGVGVRATLQRGVPAVPPRQPGRSLLHP